jgi:uncharacterized membrane protein YfcA
MNGWLLTAGLGALTGVVVAVTGAGAGVLAVPLLVFVLHLPLQQAAPVALAAVGLASAVGAVLGLREGIVRYRAAALIGTLGMTVAPLGVMALQRLPARPLLAAFAVVLAWVAWRTARGSANEGPRPTPVCLLDPVDGRLRWTAPCARVLATTGATAGFLSGLLGVGGGFVIVPALLRHTDLTMRAIQATTLAVIALVSISGTAAAVWQGSLQLPVVLPFAAAAIVTLLLVRPLVRHWPARRLQLAFAAVCALVAALMLARAAGWA